MEYAKDEGFRVRYNTALNRLEMKNENWTSRWGKILKKHKFITTIMIAFFTFAVINLIMIGNFIRILQSV